MNKILFRIAGALVLSAAPAFAHRPYERAAGTFQRSDGTILSVIQHYTDGIIATDPVSIHFRLPDGTVLARTDYVYDAVIRHPSPQHVEVYAFESTFVPIAARVYRFDGYSLSDLTSRRTRLLSPLVHIASHWLGYLVMVGIGSFLYGVWFAVRGLPTRGWFVLIQGLGFIFIILGGAVYLVMLLVSPISLVVLTGFGSIIFLLTVFIRNRLRNSLPRNQAMQTGE